MITVTGENLDQIKHQVGFVERAVLRIYRRGIDPEHFMDGRRRPGCIIKCELEEVELVFENSEAALEYIATVLNKMDENARGSRGLA